ncbi:hypothetical protein KP79_PYT01076 [Mizuhopecten yessoensis]|uniref:Uncharacterized protein n=1 Tax=Mizuhopecten yessoensis TaxID=6573 RepID=A0A210QKX5_MIZYE|nr:hypothetical protein KP79_PYT01076 [Mizuhopecten yessoensis]
MDINTAEDENKDRSTTGDENQEKGTAEDEDMDIMEDELIVPDSAEDDDKSDIYPALNSSSVLLCKESLDSDEESNDVPEEDSISRDVNHRGVYVKLVVKNGYTNLGKRKKSDRVYNSTHPCPLCDKTVTNFSHHILSKKHANDADVTKIGTLSGKEKKVAIQKMRLKGSHKHNMKVLKEKKGEIFLLRRSSNKKTDGVLGEEDEEEDENQSDCMATFDMSKYGPCPECLGWVLLKSIKRHMKTCCVSKDPTSSKCQLIVQSDLLSERITEEASKALVSETFTIMQQDEVAKVAKNDSLIVTLGNTSMLRNAGNKVMRRYYTSSVMRLAAKFKMELLGMDCTDLREEKNKDDCDQGEGKDGNSMKKELSEFLRPQCFDMIVAAALKCSCQDAMDEEDLKTPSNALKLGYDIKKMVSAKLGRALMKDDAGNQKDAEGLLKLMDMEWGVRVNKLARIALTERSFNAERQLPLPEDIKKLCAYLLTEIGKLDLTDCSYENFRKVATLSLARVTLYNRRRCHEVQALRLVFRAIC